MSTTTNLHADNSDFELEYKDVISDTSNPEMRQIAETIPEKYKEKTVDDLIDMHVNLEKVLRRQGNELGQLRKLTDTQSQLLAVSTRAGSPQPGQNTAAEPHKPAPITAEALLTRPDEALNQAVSSNPSVTQQNHRLNQIEMNLARKEFESKNTTYRDDVNDPQFQEWVVGSATRQRLLQTLHTNYDFGAGQELWELWNEHKEAKGAAEAVRNQKVNAATTVRGSSAEVTPSNKPIYSRAKLAELQLKAEAGIPSAVARWNDPQFQHDYQLAYHEDRVR